MIAELSFLLVAAALALPELVVRAFDAGAHCAPRPPVLSPRIVPS